MRLKKIENERLRKFAEVKEEIISKIMQNNKIAANYQNIKDFHNAIIYNSAEQKNNLNNYGIKLTPNVSLTRADISFDEKYPSLLLKAIFAGNNISRTNIIIENDFAYFAVIKGRSVNKAKYNKLTKDSLGHFEDLIKRSGMQDIIAEIANKDNMVINDF